MSVFRAVATSDLWDEYWVPKEGISVLEGLSVVGFESHLKDNVCRSGKDTGLRGLRRRWTDNAAKSVGKGLRPFFFNSTIGDRKPFLGSTLGGKG